MAKNLSEARRALLRAQELAKRRLEELENERREIKASLKSLDAAMKALNSPRDRRSQSKRSSAGNNPADQAPEQE